MNRNRRLKCSLSLRAFAVLMFLWLFHVRPLFRSIAVMLLSTNHYNLAHADKRNCTCVSCVCYGFEVYTRRYTRMGLYN